jgi:hypothetical protein
MNSFAGLTALSCGKSGAVVGITASLISNIGKSET